MDDQPNATPAAAMSAPESQSHAPQAGGVKETIESILIAFILAFIFRAFVVEAFVIPTGSMAPTLLGAHIRFDCKECGYTFDLNYSAGAQSSEDINIPAFAQGRKEGVCPNCGYVEAVSNAPIRYGDRILVLKYLYLFQQPQPWDVVVFKAPLGKPYQQNYIKRLIGVPGESVLILDGDIYTAQHGATEAEDFRIRRKTPDAQQALWRLVYHNDYFPRGSTARTRPFEQPWRQRRGQSGWQLTQSLDDPRSFIFDGLDKQASIYFDKDCNPYKRALTDWLAYDNEAQPASTLQYVSDLKLDLYYTRREGDGPLQLKLSKRDDTFIAEFTPHGVALKHSRFGVAEAQVLSERAMSFSSGRPYHVQFVNVDYRVSLLIDGELVLQTTDEQYQPDPRRLIEEYVDGHAAPPPAIEITAANQRCELSHVALWRDVYYLNRDMSRRGMTFWASPGNVIHLGEDEYFVLGDNSPISEDARYWERGISLPDEDLAVESGRVPGRFLLGKAFFVYWPAGYPLVGSSPAIVPNFGEMRFIH